MNALSRIVYAIVFVGMSMLQCFADPLAEKQVPSEAISGWQSMADIVDPVQWTVQYLNGEDGVSEVQACAIQGDLRKCERWPMDVEMPLRQALLYNKRSFSLSESSQGKWQLSVVGRPGESEGMIQNLTFHARNGYALHGSALLVDTVHDSRFEVLGWKKVGANVVYEVRDRSDGLRSEMTLNPEKRFRVEFARYYDDGEPDPVDYFYEYSDDTLLGEVVPSRHYHHALQLEWRLLSITNERLPESEFRLSHYGLPDFQEPEPKLGLRLWLLLLAVIFAVVVFWKTKKSAQTAS